MSLSRTRRMIPGAGGRYNCVRLCAGANWTRSVRIVILINTSLQLRQRPSLEATKVHMSMSMCAHPCLCARIIPGRARTRSGPGSGLISGTFAPRGLLPTRRQDRQVKRHDTSVTVHHAATAGSTARRFARSREKAHTRYQWRAKWAAAAPHCLNLCGYREGNGLGRGRESRVGQAATRAASVPFRSTLLSGLPAARLSRLAATSLIASSREPVVSPESCALMTTLSS